MSCFAGGIVLGPECLGLVQPRSLESVLPAIVSLAVGIILFEGGLTLDLRGYHAGSSVITRLLSLGVVVTWLGTTAAIHWLFAAAIPFSLLGASLVIVCDRADGHRAALPADQGPTAAPQHSPLGGGA